MRAWLGILAFAAVTALAQDKPEETLSAVVSVSARALPDARSNATLGQQRRGSGALIDQGYVLTIGYLVIEAESIEVTGADGRKVPATLAGYDHASGFGLLKLVAPLAGRPLPLGDAAVLGEREPALVATSAEREGASIVYVVSRRPFTGSWEYQLDSAIFTYPAVDAWSGAPLIGAKGELLGIGSLIVPDAGGVGTQSPGNMFVPVDLLKPILAEMRSSGTTRASTRPWLGLNCVEYGGHVRVIRLSAASPSEEAGLQPGDLITAVDGIEVGDLASFYKALWRDARAERDVTLQVKRGAETLRLTVRSVDRMKTLSRPQGV
jgi:S1-C subfamily serine protease